MARHLRGCRYMATWRAGAGFLPPVMDERRRNMLARRSPGILFEGSDGMFKCYLAQVRQYIEFGAAASTQWGISSKSLSQWRL